MELKLFSDLSIDILSFLWLCVKLVIIFVLIATVKDSYVLYQNF